MLFQPDRHTSLSPNPFSETEARAAIREIADDAIGHFDEEKLWPVHKQDDIPVPVAGLYLGASGVIWALDYLKREGAIETLPDFSGVLPSLIQRDTPWLTQFGFGGYGSLLMGDLGPLLLSMRMKPDAAIADRIFARIEGNNALPVLELMWGTPGSMLACVFMYEMTSDTRFGDAFKTQAARLLEDLVDVGGYRMWTPFLYGQEFRSMGPVHGFSGNMVALMRGWKWLTQEQQRTVADVCQQTSIATAQRVNDDANWPSRTGDPTSQLFCQYCHGAAGTVTALADAPFSSPEFDELLVAGATLTWHAGALTKGSNLCHGTAGNGYVFLKMFKRTGDAKWLERAKVFAQTAIEQVRNARSHYGVGRYSLWTGDIGVAIYLWDCIQEKALFPTVDVF